MTRKRVSPRKLSGTPSLLCLWILFGASSTAAAQNPGIVVGVNWVIRPGITVEQEDTTLKDLKIAGVRVVRSALPLDPSGVVSDAGLDLARRINAQGISILWLVRLRYPDDAPSRPYLARDFPHEWSGHPLSYADPELFRASFQELLNRLEKAGIRLTAFELGNELNGAAFNAEFPLPGQGKLFGLSDLSTDPEAKQIAKGYLRYLKVLSVLKDVRDHSTLNRNTPILSFGLAASELPEGPVKGWKIDGVSANATLQYLRSNGLDNLADGYAVHIYPWSTGPGIPSAMAERQDHLAKYDLAECRPEGSANGKPCWITEWGFANADPACPVNETSQIALVDEMKGLFREYASRGRLQGLIYYAWVDGSEHFGVFRCGKLTGTGRSALSPP